MSDRGSASRRQFLSQTGQRACLATTATSLVARPATVLQAAVVKEISLQVVREFVVKVSRPRGLAVDRMGRLFVGSDKGVVVLNLKGRQLTQIRIDRPVRCLATRRTGELLVGKAHEIEVFGADLMPGGSWESLGENALVTALVSVGAETFVGDSKNGVVWHFDEHGRVVKSIQRTPAGFATPPGFFSMTAGDGDRLHIVNPLRHRVETYRTNGEFVSSWGRKSRDVEGFSGCCNPVAIAMRSDGRFVTAERGQIEFKLFDKQGEFQQVVKKTDSVRTVDAQTRIDNDKSCTLGGVDLAVDDQDRVYALDGKSGIIRVLA